MSFVRLKYKKHTTKLTDQNETEYKKDKIGGRGQYPSIFFKGRIYNFKHLSNFYISNNATDSPLTSTTHHWLLAYYSLSFETIYSLLFYI